MKYVYIEVIAYASGHVLHRVDVTKKSRTQQMKVEAGMNINLDHDRFYTRTRDCDFTLVTVKDGQKQRGHVTPKGFCHPTHAQRTKCACGRVLSLKGAVGQYVVVCACGRRHRKASGSGFARGHMVQGGRITTGSREGGREGCPGLEGHITHTQTKTGGQPGRTNRP